MSHLLFNIPSPPEAQGTAQVLHLLCYPGTQENPALAQSRGSGVRAWVLLWQGCPDLSGAQPWDPPLALTVSLTTLFMGTTQAIQPQLTLALQVASPLVLPQLHLPPHKLFPAQPQAPSGAPNMGMH